MYELIFITDSSSEKADGPTIASVRGFINEQGGVIKKEDTWEKRKLAYPIKKHVFGFYTVIQFELEKEKIEELQKQLRMNGNLLRFLIIDKTGVKEDVHKPRMARPKAVVAPKPTDEKTERVKIEEIDKKLEEILKE